jgi:hypothetical protein
MWFDILRSHSGQDNDLSVSLLQHRLNELKTGIAVGINSQNTGLAETG